MAVILPAPVYVITSELAAKPTEYKIGTSKTVNMSHESFLWNSFFNSILVMVAKVFILIPPFQTGF